MTDSEKNLPLAGVRILDIATFVAAPFASRFCQFGAVVIKVEDPKGGDHGGIRDKDRPRQRHTRLDDGITKQDVGDLRPKDTGCRILKRLVKVSDVMCENFRPGTLERWGLSWEVLSAVDPDWCCCGYRVTANTIRIRNALDGANCAGVRRSHLSRRYARRAAGHTRFDLARRLYVGTLRRAWHPLGAEKPRATGEGQVIDMALYESIFGFSTGGTSLCEGGHDPATRGYGYQTRVPAWAFSDG